MAIVLPSQDCFKSQFSPMKTLDPDPRKKFQSSRSAGRRKRSPVQTTGRCRPSASDVVVRFPAKNLVMEKVKILKRGEDPLIMKRGERNLESPTKDQSSDDSGDEKKKVRFESFARDDFVATSSVMGPEPEMVPKHNIGGGAKDDAGLFEGDFAGSTFITSPSPSSVPLPGFFFKKNVSSRKDDAATKDLLRILRLDLP